jgi:hypothetical protein
MGLTQALTLWTSLVIAQVGRGVAKVCNSEAPIRREWECTLSLHRFEPKNFVAHLERCS